MEKSKIQLSEESVIKLLDAWSFPGALTVQPTNQGTYWKIGLKKTPLSC